MAAIRLRDAVAVISGFPALAGVDLEVDPGEVVAVTGANGAGKSSLLRLCAGLLRLQSGSGEVLGHDLASDRAAVRRRVGVLGHDTALYDDLTVEENLRFWARASRTPVDDVGPALDRLDVAPRVRAVLARRLSAGQRRRVALAAVLIRRPELWLLDEPHAGLDQDARTIVDLLIADAAGQGATVVFASHELERAVPLASRAVALGGGVVMSDSDPGAGRTC